MKNTDQSVEHSSPINVIVGNKACPCSNEPIVIILNFKYIKSF